MARRRKPATAPLDMEPPEWLWGEPLGRIALRAQRTGENGMAAIIRARKEWRAERDKWLSERGLVVWGMEGLSYSEFQRIQKQEPHRILRRPDIA
ncbi:hypothetical protein GTY86_33790 [Streptomyces sp. SID5770]|uniref:hypothetical protein n=1 Tax=Streptomyces sp. SID5770 TaxID=2690308 RepID=UPI001367EAD7|nr:hypothetical protein [Streptomyces sp. SID5770]MZE56158.1 hypothetical protein [Streptomyces sp. SID5770]